MAAVGRVSVSLLRSIMPGPTSLLRDGAAESS
jgi:hypothetical protein